MKKFLYLLSALVLSACAGEKTVPVLQCRRCGYSGSYDREGGRLCV